MKAIKLWLALHIRQLAVLVLWSAAMDADRLRRRRLAARRDAASALDPIDRANADAASAAAETAKFGPPSVAVATAIAPVKVEPVK